MSEIPSLYLEPFAPKTTISDRSDSPQYDNIAGGATIAEYHRRYTELNKVVGDRIMQNDAFWNFCEEFGDRNGAEFNRGSIERSLALEPVRALSGELGKIKYKPAFGRLIECRIVSQTFDQSETYLPFSDIDIGAAPMERVLSELFPDSSDPLNSRVQELLGLSSISKDRVVAFPAGFLVTPFVVNQYGPYKQKLPGTAYQTAFYTIGISKAHNGDPYLRLEQAGKTTISFSEEAILRLRGRVQHQDRVNEAIDSSIRMAIAHPYFNAFGQGKQS